MYTPFYRKMLNETVARERANWEASMDEDFKKANPELAERLGVNHFKTGPEPSQSMPAAKPNEP